MKSTGEFAEEEKGDIQHLRLCTDLEIDLVACIVKFWQTGIHQANMDKKLTLRYNTPKRGCFYADFAL